MLSRTAIAWTFVASAVVVWQLKGSAKARERKALRVIGVAFVVLALYMAAQSSYVLVVGFRPHHSQLGIVWVFDLSLLDGAHQIRDGPREINRHFPVAIEDRCGVPNLRRQFVELGLAEECQAS